MAEPSPAADTQKLSLSAQYSHPTDTPFTAEASTDGPSSASAADKSAFLARLRDLVTIVQADVNTQLTQKMEEDKQRAAGARDEKGKKKNNRPQTPHCLDYALLLYYLNMRGASRSHVEGLVGCQVPSPPLPTTLGRSRVDERIRPQLPDFCAVALFRHP
ncbi:hypothetical protein HYQ46_005309 [Verticillium longisporum]|nr:hypothetical protein HYQ46_005309 [Verticillium longisporum]